MPVKQLMLQTAVEEADRGMLELLRAPVGVPVYWLLGQQIFFDKVLRLTVKPACCFQSTAPVESIIPIKIYKYPNGKYANGFICKFVYLYICLLFNLPPELNFQFSSLILPLLGLPFFVLFLATGHAYFELN